jgi:hypothetical protein
VVLVSSRDSTHIRRNASIACDPPADDLLDAFEELLGAVAGAGPVDQRAGSLGGTSA